MVAALSFGLAGCDGNLSILDPAGPAAASTATLFIVMLVGATLILLLVCALFLLAFLKPAIGATVPARAWLVWGGLVFPGITLSTLLVFALVSGERLLPHPGTGDIVVEAHPEQWRWRFRYPDGRETIDVLHLPANRAVDVRVVGGDVIHSFWIPRLAGKIDAIPGHVNTIRILADRPGRYGGVCAEFCGTGHALMRFEAEAHEPSAFEGALAAATRRPGVEQAMQETSR